MCEINNNNLSIGIEYRIEVPGHRPGDTISNGLTFGTYLGKSVFEDENNSIDDIEDFEDFDNYQEYDEFDNRNEYLFIINNDNDNNTNTNTKIEKIKHGTTLLKFIRPESFNPWGKNIVLDNVTNFLIQRKWRPSRSRYLEIPDYIAQEYLQFYEKVDTEERALDSIFKQFGVYQPQLSYMITSYNKKIKNFWEM